MALFLNGRGVACGPFGGPGEVGLLVEWPYVHLGHRFDGRLGGHTTGRGLSSELPIRVQTRQSPYGQ